MGDLESVNCCVDESDRSRCIFCPMWLFLEASRLKRGEVAHPGPVHSLRKVAATSPRSNFGPVQTRQTRKIDDDEPLVQPCIQDRAQDRVRVRRWFGSCEHGVRRICAAAVRMSQRSLVTSGRFFLTKVSCPQSLQVQVLLLVVGLMQESVLSVRQNIATAKERRFFDMERAVRCLLPIVGDSHLVEMWFQMVAVQRGLGWALASASGAAPAESH